MKTQILYSVQILLLAAVFVLGIAWEISPGIKIILLAAVVLIGEYKYLKKI